MLALGNAKATALSTAAATDQAAISKLSQLDKKTWTVVGHVDLTAAFGTKSQWAFVVAKQSDEESITEDGAGNPTGPISLCFVVNARPDCSETLFLEKLKEQNLMKPAGEKAFYELLAGEIVQAGTGEANALLKVKACSLRGANGNCGASTYLLSYDSAADKFRVVFFNYTGRNNNQETRFVGSGPLLGDVIGAYPTNDAPFGYLIEVYKRDSTGNYARVLRYRSRTRYNDGNRLAVIDSEMPVLLQKLGLWSQGDPLPQPSSMPPPDVPPS